MYGIIILSLQRRKPSHREVKAHVLRHTGQESTPVLQGSRGTFLTTMLHCLI